MMICGRTIDITTRHLSHRACPAMWASGRTRKICIRDTEEDVMAQPRPRSTHVDTWIVTTISLPAALAGALRVPLRNRTIPAPWGLPSPSRHQSVWVPITAALAALTFLLTKGALLGAAFAAANAATLVSKARRLS